MSDFFLFKDLIGVPFKDGGRDRDGIDCWGVCMEVMRRVGKIELPNFYKPEDENDLVHMFLRGEEFVEELKKPEPYCLVALATFSNHTNHVGVVLKDCLHFIHSTEKRNGVCIERLDHMFWRGKIKGFYKWKNNA